MSLSKRSRGNGQQGKDFTLSDRAVATLEPGVGALPVGNGKGAPQQVEEVKVTAPNIRTVQIRITGTAPYLQCRFSEKAQQAIMKKQTAGDQPGKRPKRAPRDYDADYKGAMHKFPDGTCGMPASAFRAAAISACRLVGFKMTMAKLAIFVEADGYDVVDSTPLVKINGEPEKHIMMGRNSDGSPDVRVRAIFKKWSAVVAVRFDADQFSLTDVINLFARIGTQIGIGEGRPDSKNSAGMGLGLFEINQ